MIFKFASKKLLFKTLIKKLLFLLLSSKFTLSKMTSVILKFFNENKLSNET